MNWWNSQNNLIALWSAVFPSLELSPIRLWQISVLHRNYQPNSLIIYLNKYSWQHFNKFIWLIWTYQSQNGINLSVIVLVQSTLPIFLNNDQLFWFLICPEDVTCKQIEFLSILWMIKCFCLNRFFSQKHIKAKFQSYKKKILDMLHSVTFIPITYWLVIQHYT